MTSEAPKCVRCGKSMVPFDKNNAFYACPNNGLQPPYTEGNQNHPPYLISVRVWNNGLNKKK